MDVPQLMMATVGVPDLPWQFVVGVFILTTALVAATRKRLSNQRQYTAPRTRTRVAQANSPKRQAIESDMREVLLEMEKLARQVNAQIENKYQKLEVVIRDADARLAELRSLLEAGTPVQTARSLNVTVAEEAGAYAPAATDPDHADLDSAVICSAADAGRSAAQIAEQLSRPIGEIELFLSLHRADTSEAR